MALRLAKEDLEAVQQFTGEPSYGRAAKAAVLEYLRWKRDGSLPPPISCSPSPAKTQAPGAANAPQPPKSPAAPATPSPEQSALPEIAKTLAALTQIIQDQKSHPASPSSSAGRVRQPEPAVVPSPEQDAIRDSLKITEAEFKTFFAGLQARGQRDATPANEDAFWQYLLLVDFTRSDGAPVTRRNVGQTFNAWVRIENKDARAEKAKADADAAAKKEAEEKEAADRKAYEDWNNRMLNWDGDDD